MLPVLFGASAVMGMFGNAQQQKQQNAQYEAAANANKATNLNIGSANMQNAIRTGMRVGILNIQQGMAKKQATEQGYAISQQKQAVLGATNANIAASGTVGSSVEAVVQDVNKKVDEAQINVDQNLVIEQMNLNQQLADVVMSGKDSIRNAQLMDYSGPGTGGAGGLLAAGFAGAAQTAIGLGTQYLMAKQTLGLGQG